MKGYSGPLCAECDSYGKIWDEKYRKDGADCIDCEDAYNWWIITKFIVSFFFVIWFI